METTRIDEVVWKADKLVRVLELARDGKGLGNFKDLTPSKVAGILAAHGWPDPDRLAENLAALRRLGPAEVCFEFSYLHEVKPSPCRECDAVFPTAHGLANHRTRKHTRVPA